MLDCAPATAVVAVPLAPPTAAYPCCWKYAAQAATTAGSVGTIWVCACVFGCCALWLICWLCVPPCCAAHHAYHSACVAGAALLRAPLVTALEAQASALAAAGWVYDAAGWLWYCCIEGCGCCA